MKASINLALLCSGLYLTTSAQQLTTDVGYASFYHDYFIGRTTASGEKFSQKQMTCAHKSLPFGTKLCVTNLSNGKSILVTVTDRGPYCKGRIVDLTRKAAGELDFVKAGVTKVHIEIVPDRVEEPQICLSSIDSMQLTLTANKMVCDTCTEQYSIRAVSFSSEESMLQTVALLKEKFGKQVSIEYISTRENPSYLIFIGVFYKRDEATHFLDTIENWYPDAMVSQLASVN